MQQLKLFLVMPWHEFQQLKSSRPDLPWSKFDRWFETYQQAKPMIAFYKQCGYRVHVVFDPIGLRGLHDPNTLI